MSTSRIAQWVGIGISLTAIFFLVRSLHVDRVVTAFTEADYWWLVPAIAISLTSFIFRSERFRIFLLSLKIFSLGRAYAYIAINYMGNNVLPARAGEVLLSYIVMKQESIPISSSLAVTVFGRVIDGLWLLTLLVVGLLFLPFPDWVDQVLLIGLTFFGLAMIILLWLVFGDSNQHKQLYQLGHRYLSTSLQRLAGFMVGQVKSFQHGLQALKNPSIVWRSLILTMAIWLCEGLVYYLVGQAMHINQSIWQWVFVLAIANLAASIPSGPASIGTFEGVILVVLGFNGIPAHQAAAFALLLHATQVIPVTLIGAISYARLSVSSGMSIVDAST